MSCVVVSWEQVLLHWYSSRAYGSEVGMGPTNRDALQGVRRTFHLIALSHAGAGEDSWVTW